ncbi:hypothetical protein J6590_058290 [Homalodisca vitripennis]|nr:hypothetical protein J6590_058290 [Homalodisca vitripennis]
MAQCKTINLPVAGDTEESREASTCHSLKAGEACARPEHVAPTTSAINSAATYHIFTANAVGRSAGDSLLSTRTSLRPHHTLLSLSFEESILTILLTSYTASPPP